MASRGPGAAGGEGKGGKKGAGKDGGESGGEGGAMKGKPLKICSVADTCDYCGQTSTTKRCSACHDARYCDMICLQKHRSDHKPQCLLIQEEKAKKEAKARKRAEVLEGLGDELHNASFYGKEARVGQLLKLGIDVNYVVTKEGGAKGCFPLYMAWQNNHVEVVRLLLAVEGVSVNQACTTDGNFPLYMACQKNHVEVVRLLLAAQAQVDQVKDGGWSACNKAALEGHVQVLEMLLEAGADVQLKSDDGCTALDLAIEHEQPAAEAVIRKHLAKAKLEAESKDGVGAM